jgi:hypothetical protein
MDAKQSSKIRVLPASKTRILLLWDYRKETHQTRLLSWMLING